MIRREAFNIGTLLIGCGRGAAMVSLVMGLGMMTQQLTQPPDFILPFLLPVIVSARIDGLVPAVVTALISLLSLSVAFIEPVGSPSIALRADFFELAIFLVVALVASIQTSDATRQAREASERAELLSQTADFGAHLAQLSTTDLPAAIATGLAQRLPARLALFCLEPTGPRLLHTVPADLPVQPWMIRALSVRSDRLSDSTLVHTLPAAPPLGLVIMPADQGVFGLKQRLLAETLLAQATLALDRAALDGERANAAAEAETERLRGNLLAAVSHDLRTPLASILGAATSLSSYFDRYSDNQRADLLATIQEEAERLNRHIGQVLDTSRIGAGVLEPHLQPVDLEDLIAVALRRSHRQLADRRVIVDIPDDFPPLRLDPTLIEPVFLNLFDNIAKYCPAGSPMTLSANVQDNQAVIRVIDCGPGIPAELRDQVFDPFFRVRSVDRRRAGSGLGLSICRGFVQACGGIITVEEGPGGIGTSFVLTFPMVHAQPQPNVQLEGEAP